MPNRTDIWSLNISMKCGRISSLESVSSHCRLSAPQMFENAIQLPELQDKARLEQGSLQGVEVGLCAGHGIYTHATNQEMHLRFYLGFDRIRIEELKSTKTVLLFSTFQMCFISRTT